MKLALKMAYTSKIQIPRLNVNLHQKSGMKNHSHYRIKSRGVSKLCQTFVVFQIRGYHLCSARTSTAMTLPCTKRNSRCPKTARIALIDPE